ncbi:MAG: hypothetical protein AAGI25_02645 [Bacteroidota bacterium]
MAKKLFFLVLVYNISFNLPAQWKVIREVMLDQTPTAFSADINANIYIGYDDGSLVKYDDHGEELTNYALPNLSEISLIDPQFQLKTFLFYYDIQQITILDRLNSVPKNYSVKDLGTGLVNMACPAPDGTIWLIENNPMLLKRIDLNRKTLIQETQPSLGKDIRAMRTFQNILLIVDESGLHILDQFGSTLFFYKGAGISSMSIWKNSVYLEHSNKIIKINLFDERVISTLESPMKNIYRFIYVNKTYLFLMRNKLIYYQRTK